MSLTRVEGYLRTADEAARAGDVDRAASALRLAQQAAEALPPASAAQGLILVARAEAAVRAGDRAHGAILLEQACALDERHGRADAGAIVRLLRAALACQAAGRVAAGRELARRARMLAEREAPGLVPDAQEVLARLDGRPVHQPPPVTPARADMPELQAQLDALVGLEGVKEEVRRVVALAQVSRARAEAGLPAGERTRHLVFCGAPGTGKTTVARILGQMYGALGVVSKGHLVEVTRADLVAGYVGQTAAKVNAVVESALDGVLFIDEAYSLAGGGGEDFGREALAELVKRMEDDRGRLVVILAGYDAPMQELLDVNPGLRSRVQAVLQFADYAPEQLAEIFARMAAAGGWRIDEATRARAAERLTVLHQVKDASWANARTARALLEETLARHALRVTADGQVSREELDHLVAEDVPAD